MIQRNKQDVEDILHVAQEKEYETEFKPLISCGTLNDPIARMKSSLSRGLLDDTVGSPIENHDSKPQKQHNHLPHEPLYQASVHIRMFDTYMKRLHSVGLPTELDGAHLSLETDVVSSRVDPKLGKLHSCIDQIKTGDQY